MADKKRVLHLDIYDYSGNKLCPIYDNYVDIPGQATNVFIATERNGWRELSFDLPTIVQYDEGTKENIIVSYLKADFLIRSIEDDTEYDNKEDAIDWFLISEPKISHNAYTKTISVIAGNASQLLKNKNLGLEFSDNDGNNIGTCEQLLDTILEGTEWKRGYVYPFADKDGSKKYRTLKASSKTGCFKLITMMCELFDAKPVFRTNRHVVDIYPINPFYGVKEGEIPDYAKENGTIELYYGTNVKAITRTQNTENIRTKLYAYGSFGDKTLGYCDISESVHTEYTFKVNFELVAGEQYYFRVEDLDGIMVYFVFTPTENIAAGRKMIYSLLDPASMSYVWVEKGEGYEIEGDNGYNTEHIEEPSVAFFVKQGMSGTLLFDMNYRDNDESKSYIDLYREYKNLIAERAKYEDEDVIATIDSRLAEVTAMLPLSADGSYLTVDNATVEVDYEVENMFSYIMDFDYYISVGLFDNDMLQKVASFQRNAKQYYEKVKKASAEMSEGRSKLSDLIGTVPFCKLKIKRADWTISDYLTLFLDYGEITHPDDGINTDKATAIQYQYPRGVIYRTDYDVTNDSYFKWVTTYSLNNDGDPTNAGCSVLYIFHKATDKKPVSWDKYYLKAVFDDQVNPKAIQLWVSYEEAMKTIDIENDEFYLFQSNSLSGYIGSNEALDEAAIESLENATTIATVPHVTVFTDNPPSTVVIPSGQGGNLVNSKTKVSFPMYHWLWCYNPLTNKKSIPSSDVPVTPINPDEDTTYEMTSDEISLRLSSSSDEWINKVASPAWQTLCLVDGYTLEQLITYSSQWSRVDLGSRQKIPAPAMQLAGWTDFNDDSYATLYSSARGIGTELHPFTVVATPILPDGTVLSPESFYEYLDTKFQDCTTSDRVETSDNKKIIIQALDGWDDATVLQSEVISQTVHSLSEAIEYMKDNNLIVFNHMVLSSEYIEYAKSSNDSGGLVEEEAPTYSGSDLIQEDMPSSDAAEYLETDGYGFYYYNYVYDTDNIWKFVLYSDEKPTVKIPNAYWYNWRANTLCKYNSSNNQWVDCDEESDKNGASLFGTVYHICKQRDMYWQGTYLKRTFSLKKFAKAINNDEDTNLVIPAGNYYFDDGYDGFCLFTTDVNLESQYDDSITYNSQKRWITVKHKATETAIKTKSYSFDNVYYHPSNIITQKLSAEGWIDFATGEASDTWKNDEGVSPDGNTYFKCVYNRTYFPVVPGCIYDITSSIGYSMCIENLVVHFYNAKQQWISCGRIQPKEVNQKTLSQFVTPGNCYYVRIAELGRYQWRILESGIDGLVISVYGTLNNRYKYDYKNTIVVEDMTYLRLPINEYPEDNQYIGLLENMQNFLDLSDDTYITKYNAKNKAQKAADDYERQMTSALNHMHREGWWQDASYVDGDESRLYTDALDNLREIAKPEVTYNIEFLDLYSSNMGSKDFGASEITSDIDFPDLNITSAIHLVDDDLNLNCWAYVDKIKKCYDKPWLTTITVNTKLSTLEQHSFTDVMTHIADVASEVKGKMSRYDNATNKLLANFNVNYLQGLISETDQTLKSSFKKIETIDGKLLTYETMIRQNAESISLEAARSYEEERSMRALLNITAEEIKSRVENVEGITEKYTEVKQTAEGIYGTYVDENNEQHTISTAAEFIQVFEDPNTSSKTKHMLSETLYGSLNVITDGNDYSLVSQDKNRILALVSDPNIDKPFKTQKIDINKDGIDITSNGYLNISSEGKFIVNTPYFDVDENGRMTTTESYINNAVMYNCYIWGQLYNEGYPVLSTKSVVYQSDQPQNPTTGMIWLKPTGSGGGGEEPVVDPTGIGTRVSYTKFFHYEYRQTLEVNDSLDSLTGAGASVTLVPGQTRAKYTITISEPGFILLNSPAGTSDPGGVIRCTIAGAIYGDSNLIDDIGVYNNYSFSFTSTQWLATDATLNVLINCQKSGNLNQTYINRQNTFRITVTAEVVADT